MLEKVNKIFNVIATIFIIVALIIIVSASLSLKDGKVPNIIGYSFSIVQTPSMEPTIEVGNFVISKGEDEYNVGDIISFYSNIQGKTVSVTHRIVEVIEENEVVKYKTKGDNNTVEDTDLVTKDDVIGKIIYNSGFLGSLFSLNFISNPKYLFPIIIVILLIFIISQVSNIVKIIKENKNDRK